MASRDTAPDITSTDITSSGTTPGEMPLGGLRLNGTSPQEAPGDGELPGEATIDLREQLRMLDTEIGGLRRTGAELRAQIGEQHGSEDPAGVSTLLTMVGEQDAFVAALEARREDLRSRLARQEAAAGS